MMADEAGSFLDSSDLASYITGSPERVVGTGASPSRSYAFCTPSNIDKCVSYVNQELNGLGFLPLTCIKGIGQSQVDSVRLLNCMYELLQQHRQDLQQVEDLHCRLTRTDGDLGSARLALTRLKEEYDQQRRHLVAAEERERQAVLTNKNLSDQLRSLRDEVRRARLDHQHRASQFLHESRKSEREISRLKERLSSASASDRMRDRFSKITLLNQLPRLDGRRSSWVKGQGHEESLYQTIFANYEARQKELLVENAELRNMLSELATTNRKRLSYLLRRQEEEENQLPPVLSPSPIPEDSREVSTADLSLSFNEELTQLPLESVRQGLRDSMRQQWRMLKSHITHLESGQTGGSTPLRVEQEVLRRTIKEQRLLLEQQEKLLEEKAARPQAPAALLNVSHLARVQDHFAAERALLSEERRHLAADREELLHLACRIDQEAPCAPTKLSGQSDISILAQEFLNSSIFQSSPLKSPYLPKTPSKSFSSASVKPSPLVLSSPRFTSPPRRTAAPQCNSFSSPASQLLFRKDALTSASDSCLSSTPLSTNGHVGRCALRNIQESQNLFSVSSKSCSFISSPFGTG